LNGSPECWDREEKKINKTFFKLERLVWSVKDLMEATFHVVQLIGNECELSLEPGDKH
jgi:hypothetical protein